MPPEARLFSVGVWLQGALADRLGLRPVTACAALGLLGLVLTWRALRPRGVEALEG